MVATMTKREIALKIAWAHLGAPYIWGGDDPSGFDCSGFVVELLKSVGVLPRNGDWTANMLYHRFLDEKFSVDGGPGPGILVFWGSNQYSRITHVEMCINSSLTIGASGGGSTTLTLADAIRQNAFIKVRPFRSRAGFRYYIDPFEE